MDLQNIRLMETPYPDLVLDAGTVNFGERHRKNMDRSLKNVQCRNIVISVCALLNSGGGIVHMKVKNEGYNQKTDPIGSDIEQKLYKLVIDPSFIEIKQQNNTMMIFVQSWSNSINEGRNLPRLCSIASKVYRRTGTQCIQLCSLQVEDLLRRKSTPSGSSDEDSGSSNGAAAKEPYLIPNCGNTELPFDMLDQKEFKYGHVLNFGESDHIEFKDFSGEKISERIKEAIPLIMSSFANANGGFIFIGVTDSREIVGCRLEKPDSFISDVIGKKLKIVHNCSSPRGNIEHRLNVASVIKESEVVGSLIMLYVKQSCCVVFADNPDSWTVDDDLVKRMVSTKWAEMLLAKDPEMEEHCMNFKKELSVTASPPRCKPVFSAGGDNSLDTLVQKYYEVDCNFFHGIKTIPETVYKELFNGHPGLECLLPGMKPEGRKGILIFSRSWAVDINLPKHHGVICDALLLATGGAPLLYTIVREEDEAITEYSRNTAMSIKQKLVNVGGYAGKLCVIPKILYVDAEMAKHGNASSQQQTEHVLQVQYPESYKILKKNDITKLLKAVTIVQLHFTSVLSDKIGSEFLNLLSSQQFEILHSKHDIEKCKTLFIHGLPGTGKTVMAEHLVRRIINTFHCTRDEVLYICENRPLQIFMSRRLKCRCVTRTTFMKGEFPSVKHIIVDEAQNFRNEDGAWYDKAQALRTNKKTHPNGPGVFWIFMDYFQNSHIFVTGLPTIDDQDPKEELTIAVRNAKKIHDVVIEHVNKRLQYWEGGSSFLTKLAQSAKCNHSFEGEVEIKHNMTQKEIVNKIAEQIQLYFKEGYEPKDIAILCSTAKECERCRGSLHAELKTHLVHAEKILENVIVLDSSRRFSGLERTIVFAINPVPHSTQGKLAPNIVVCVASRARTKLHIFYEGGGGYTKGWRNSAGAAASKERRR